MVLGGWFYSIGLELESSKSSSPLLLLKGSHVCSRRTLVCLSQRVGQTYQPVGAWVARAHLHVGTWGGMCPGITPHCLQDQL